MVVSVSLISTFLYILDVWMSELKSQLKTESLKPKVNGFGEKHRKPKAERFMKTAKAESIGLIF